MPYEEDKNYAAAYLQFKMGDAIDRASPRLAIDFYAKSIALCPNFCEAHIHLGNCYYWLDDFSKALVCYQKALAINPKSFECLFNTARIYHHGCMYQKAAQYYHRAAVAKPTDHETWLDLGKCYDHIGAKDFAIYAFRKFIDLSPNAMKNERIECEARIKRLSV